MVFIQNNFFSVQTTMIKNTLKSCFLSRIFKELKNVLDINQLNLLLNHTTVSVSIAIRSSSFVAIIIAFAEPSFVITPEDCFPWLAFFSSSTT